MGRPAKKRSMYSKRVILIISLLLLYYLKRINMFRIPPLSHSVRQTIVPPHHNTALTNGPSYLASAERPPDPPPDTCHFPWLKKPRFAPPLRSQISSLKHCRPAQLLAAPWPYRLRSPTRPHRPPPATTGSTAGRPWKQHRPSLEDRPTANSSTAGLDGGTTPPRDTAVTPVTASLVAPPAGSTVDVARRTYSRRW
jgi:hypothetical protein